MKAQLEGIRALLYETTRYVDITKAYDDKKGNVGLDKDERNDFKKYSKLANVFTPLIKLFGSEYANSIAYDSLQVHGGTGFTTDFPIERIYRDARITSIYEGTSQLQVIAAIKGVTTNIFSSAIKEYESMISDENAEMKSKLMVLTAEFVETAEFVAQKNNTEILEFHARRLVEMAGNIIVTYLLILDSQRDKKYKRSAKIFFDITNSQNEAKKKYIYSFDDNMIEEYQNIIL
jgi:hypothetical protein